MLLLYHALLILAVHVLYIYISSTVLMHQILYKYYIIIISLYVLSGELSGTGTGVKLQADAQLWCTFMHTSLTKNIQMRPKKTGSIINNFFFCSLQSKHIISLPFSAWALGFRISSKMSVWVLVLVHGSWFVVVAVVVFGFWALSLVRSVEAMFFYSILVLKIFKIISILNIVNRYINIDWSDFEYHSFIHSINQLNKIKKTQYKKGWTIDIYTYNILYYIEIKQLPKFAD